MFRSLFAKGFYATTNAHTGSVRDDIHHAMKPAALFFLYKKLVQAHPGLANASPQQEERRSLLLKIDLSISEITTMLGQGHHSFFNVIKTKYRILIPVSAQYT